MFCIWLPPKRTQLSGRYQSSMRAAGAQQSCPQSSPFSIKWFTWRRVFFLLGIIGAATAWLFVSWYRDNPREHPSVNAAELALAPAACPQKHQATSTVWKAIFRSRSVWALGVQWFAHYYGFYFYITWLPIYLLKARHLNVRQGALAAGLAAVHRRTRSLLAGWATSALTAKLGSTQRARRTMGYISYGGAAALLIAFTWIQSPVIAVVVMSIPSFAAELKRPHFLDHCNGYRASKT